MRMKTHPPSISVGVGGQPAVMPATWLRNRRQILNNDALMLRDKIKAMRGDDSIREELSNELSALRVRIHQISEQIRKEEIR